ncbi:MAG: hypothetical protein AAGF90_08085 [Pseudomonadota bacterium]
MRMPRTAAAAAAFAFALTVQTPAAAAAELVMVEQDGCHWCARWDEEIAHIFPKTDEGRRAPLRRVDLRDPPDDVAFASPPVFTPTFVLVENGEELGRIEGYAGEDFFWFLLKKLVDAHLPAEEG